jgi:hypothetical protein
MLNDGSLGNDDTISPGIAAVGLKPDLPTFLRQPPRGIARSPAIVDLKETERLR